MIASLEEPKESVEFRMNIMLEDFKAYGQSVIDELTAYAEKKEGWSLAPSNYEGVRVNIEKAHGWFLLRLSLHDPLLPLNIESNDVGGAKVMLAKNAAVCDTELGHYLFFYVCSDDCDFHVSALSSSN